MPVAARTPKPKRRRERGDDGLSWDRHNKCYTGTVSLGYDEAGKRLRRRVRGKTKQEVKDKLAELHEEIKAGVHTPATYTVRQCVMDWFDSLELDPHTMDTYRGQAEKWIFPKAGAKRLADFKATDADRLLKDAAKVLTTWCAISVGACSPEWLAGMGYRSAARSEISPPIARKVSSNSPRRPVNRWRGRHCLNSALACSTQMRSDDCLCRCCS